MNNSHEMKSTLYRIIYETKGAFGRKWAECAIWIEVIITNKKSIEYNHTVAGFPNRWYVAYKLSNFFRPNDCSMSFRLNPMLTIVSENVIISIFFNKPTSTTVIISWSPSHWIKIYSNLYLDSDGKTWLVIKWTYTLTLDHKQITTLITTILITVFWFKIRTIHMQRSIWSIIVNLIILLLLLYLGN